MNKTRAINLRKVLGTLCILAIACLFAFPVSAAHTEGETVISGWGYTAGTYNSKGQIVMNVCTETYEGITAAHINSNALDTLCEGDETKTIVIPSGSTVELMNVVHINSNTTIIATGATIKMTEKAKGILLNNPTKTNYNSLKNVTIKGGTWKVSDTSSDLSVMRFSHGSNLTIDGATIIGNYNAHEIELIAMKNVVVKNCTLKAAGKTQKNSVEEALQIDVASPKTAPGLLRDFGKKFVNGQTCQNIKIINNYIKGSRGVCANAALYSGAGSYKNKFHNNITITGNTLIGTSAEACTLYNTKNAVVKNNKITTYTTRKNSSYGVGLNITIQGKTSTSAMKNTKITITGNTVKGYRQGIQVITKSTSKYATVTVKGNKCYASKKENAIYLQKRAITKAINSGNTLKKR